MHTSMYIQHARICIKDTPLFPLKWWLTGTAAAWLNPSVFYMGSRGLNIPGDLSLTSRSSSHFPAQLAAWDGAHHQPDLSAGKLKWDVRYGNIPCCVLSTASWIPGSLPKGHQDQWEPLWALAQVLLKPFEFSLPTYTDTTDTTVLPCSRPLKKLKPVTQAQTNKRLKLQW